MTHRNAKIHPAMTAIAVVMALSSTPLMAQVADEPIVTSPVINTSPAPVAADPLAAAPTADTAADPLAPAATAAKPAARKASVAKATARTTAPRARPTPARAASAAPAAAAAPAAPSMAPAEVTPAEPVPPVQAELAPVAAPATEAPAPADSLFASDEALPIAGAAGLGILALAGVGLAMRRRRRRRLEAEDAQWQNAEAEAEAEAPVEPAMAVETQPGYMPEQAEPAFVRAFEPEPVAAGATAAVAMEATPGEPGEPIDGPVTELPDGFDLSRFGPHVQAAYQGPTDDNPSLSLKHRLRRASALDQLAEREAAEAPVVAAPAAEGAVPQHDKVDFMLARTGQQPAARPASITNGRPVFDK